MTIEEMIKDRDILHDQLQKLITEFEDKYRVTIDFDLRKEFTFGNRHKQTKVFNVEVIV